MDEDEDAAAAAAAAVVDDDDDAAISKQPLFSSDSRLVEGGSAAAATNIDLARALRTAWNTTVPLDRCAGGTTWEEGSLLLLRVVPKLLFSTSTESTLLFSCRYGDGMSGACCFWES